MGRKFTPGEVEKLNRAKVEKVDYKMVRFDKVDYSIFKLVVYRIQRGYKKGQSYNDCWLAIDTETSKKENRPADGTPWENHICAWTISLRAFHKNLITIYGSRPSDMINTIANIHNALKGEITYFYCHNLPYDYQFLRKFLFRKFGFPISQLNIKPHYMINVQFGNGIILKDSLTLAQVKLETWADDLDVEHKKAVGAWDYAKIRNQDNGDQFSEDELLYIENDTLALAECLDKLGTKLQKDPYTMAYTATGIIRNEIRAIGKDNRAKDLYNRCKLSFDQYIKMTHIFHGGFTHSNRDIVNFVMPYAECYDFTSSYPYCMLSEKFPMTGFTPISNCHIDNILNNSDKYAFMFKLVMINVRLRDPNHPMPALQSSKCVSLTNPVIDNGRVLCADYAEIYTNEIDGAVLKDLYCWDHHICCEVEVAGKGYLPRWFTDYIFELFKNKTELKAAWVGGIDYTLAKTKINSCYGMTVQKFVRDIIEELYEENEFKLKDIDPEKEYNKYSNSYNTILLYQWGCWVTSYAFRNLFELGKCISGTWLYSDTDSCYASEWDYAKLYEYNDKCKMKLRANGYGPVTIDGREYWLGVAVSEGKKDQYTEFVTLGAKRYCGRSAKDGELHITVSGVPKAGAKSLNNDIKNFHEGFIFDGKTSGKLLHNYFYVDDIYIDEFGNECGDSIDLGYCDYTLDSILNIDNTLFQYDKIQVYHFESGL